MSILSFVFRFLSLSLIFFLLLFSFRHSYRGLPQPTARGLLKMAQALRHLHPGHAYRSREVCCECEKEERKRERERLNVHVRGSMGMCIGERGRVGMEKGGQVGREK